MSDKDGFVLPEHIAIELVQMITGKHPGYTTVEGTKKDGTEWRKVVPKPGLVSGATRRKQ